MRRAVDELREIDGLKDSYIAALQGAIETTRSRTRAEMELVAALRERDDDLGQLGSAIKQLQQSDELKRGQISGPGYSPDMSRPITALGLGGLTVTLRAVEDRRNTQRLRNQAVVTPGFDDDGLR